MRAFIAIELPSDIKDAISKIQDKLKTALPKVSWVKPPNLHLSLKFLGEISPEQLSDISKIAEEIANQSCVFKIGLETLGVFPDLARARIIWAGTNKMPWELGKIVEQLENKLAQAGFAKEARPFRAHITIGRIKSHLNPSEFEKAILEVNKDRQNVNLGFKAAGITIFQSTLGATGPTYDLLKAANFKIT